VRPLLLLPAFVSGPALVILVASAVGGSQIASTATAPVPSIGLHTTQLALLPPSFVRVLPDAKVSSELYVTSYNENDVDVYSEKGHNQPPSGALNGSFAQPQGIYVAKNGMVYVGDTNNDRILVYKKGASNSFETLSDVGQPRELTGDSNGTIYAGNVNQQDVAVYASGSTSPTSYLSVPSADVLGIAVDAKNDLYVSFDTQTGGHGTGQVDEFLAGSTTPINLGITLVSASGLAIDKDQNLIVCDSADSDPSKAAAYVFAPGKVTPSHTLSLPSGYPIGAALEPTDKTIFVGANGDGQVRVYSYPAFQLMNTIATGSASPPNSIALRRPATP